jgi:hypothetical protein
LQISLRTLLLSVGALAVIFALLAWHLVGGLLICLALAGATLTTLGIRGRRIGLTATGIVLLTVTLVTFLGSSNVVAWVGSRALQVQVLVIDSKTLEPIPDATLQILEGPQWLFDRRLPPDSSEFTTVMSGLRTDARGICRFTHRFSAAGMAGTFRHSSAIRTAGVWVRASADGFGTAFIPLDGQGSRRDIDNRSPVLATISLSRQTTSQTPEDRQHVGEPE